MKYNYLLDGNRVNPLKFEEAQVIQLLCEGEDIKSIAGIMDRGRDSINMYIRNAKDKLKVNTRDQLVAVAVKKELIDFKSVDHD